MSTKSAERKHKKKRQQVLELLHEDFAPWQKSRQARYHAGESWEKLSQVRDDGSRIYQTMEWPDGTSVRPFHKVLKQQTRIAERYGNPAEGNIPSECHPMYRYPSAWFDALIHVDDTELWALEESRTDDPVIAEQLRTRREVLEWLADPRNEHVLKAMGDGGTDIWAHSKPGGGKTSFATFAGGVRMPEINNETVLWMLTLDELECLPLAPFMTVAKPTGTEIVVEAQPRSPSLPSVEIELTDVFRDTITYGSPRGLLEQVVPGGLYAVLPDPRFRGCEKLVKAAFTPARDAEEPAEVTPLRDFTFAMLETRAKDDEFLHPTTMINDEFSDLVPLNPEADENDTNQKVKGYPVAQGKARKKNLSTINLSHSISRCDEGVREKNRWFATMPKTAPPSSTLSGIGNVPIDMNYINKKIDETGKAAVWRNQHFAPIRWPNPYRTYEFRGEINIRYPRREEALDAL